MSKKTIDTEIPETEEQPTIRLEYNSPRLEEYGELHELTHGMDGDGTDIGGRGTGPFGIMEP